MVNNHNQEEHSTHPARARGTEMGADGQDKRRKDKRKKKGARTPPERDEGGGQEELDGGARDEEGVAEDGDPHDGPHLRVGGDL